VSATIDRERIQELAQLDRNAIISHIKQALKQRSGKAWSVTGGRGTAYGWITIRARGEHWMEPERCAELAALLGLERVHPQGESIPASMAYRRVALAQAIYGNACGFTAEQYWD